MERKQLEDLVVYNSGSSRSRITLVAAPDHVGEPHQIANTRWIVFGQAAADAFRALVRGNSYLKLHGLIPGGFSSSTWQGLQTAWQLYPPTIAAHANGPEGHALHFLTFGAYNSRVILLRAGSGFQPQRLPGTSIVALSPRASQLYRDFLAGLPGDTAAAYRLSAGLIPGGLTPTTIHRSRQALRDS